MKTNLKAIPIAVLFALNTLTVFADEVEVRPLLVDAVSNELPTTEKAFVDAINKFDKKSIIEKLGEPAKTDDVKLKGSDKVVASIWQYHNINTAEDGSYYPTTELDFIDGKVVQVVFLNNDGSEADVKGQTYEIPPELPNEVAPQATPNEEPGDGVPLIEY